MNFDLQKKVEELFREGDAIKISAYKKGAGPEFNFVPRKEQKEAYKLGVASYLDRAKISINPELVSDPVTFKGFFYAYWRQRAKNEGRRQEYHNAIIANFEVFATCVQNQLNKETKTKFSKGVDIALKYFKEEEIRHFKSFLEYIGFSNPDKLPKKTIDEYLALSNIIQKESPSDEADYFKYMYYQYTSLLQDAKNSKIEGEALDYLDHALFFLHLIFNSADSRKIILEDEKDNELDKQGELDKYILLCSEINKKGF
ncbi:hypothetical protein HZA33_03920 [Candidatus Pacearchaeota archaeon]|nr:hypothetical protein [Candidatus Pacearchaeota archaeon]